MLLEPGVTDELEALLGDILAARPMPANLRDAAAYAVLGGGKRLRPVLVMRSFEAVGKGETDRRGRRTALTAAVALELIHTFSLVHDDLPAMDDDDLRRGRPTLHRHTGEAMAILTGDLLTAMAFEVLASRVDDPALAAKLVGELAAATGDMIAGQVYDTLPEASHELHGDGPLDCLRRTHRHKTGALLRCGARMGGLCGGADDATLGALSDYADAIGLMFQVVDDLLDVTSTAEQLGKAAGKDAAAGKLTYPGLLGVEASRGEVQRLHREAEAALDPLGEGAGPLRELAAFLAGRER